jgi:predicted PurR-regulated permease PerM
MTAPIVPSPVRPSGWRRQITIGFGVVAGLILLLLIFIFRPLIRPILWAAALATLVYPAHRRLLDRVGGHATVAAVLSTAFWLAVLVVPAILAVSQVVGEARDLWPAINRHMGDGSFRRFAEGIEQSPWRGVVHVAAGIPANSNAAALEERMRTGVEAFGDYVQQMTRQFTLGAPGALVQISITIVTFFFFLRQGPGWVARLREALPVEPAVANALVDTVGRTIGAVFRGVLLTAFSQAFLATAGYFVAGAPVPLLLGFVTMVTALLPFVGAAAVWVPTAIGIYLSGHPGAAIALSIWGVAVVSLVDNFLRPYLIGRETKIPLLWLFLSIVGGLQAFGFLGLLLGPAALSLSLACYKIYSQSTRVLETPQQPSM